MKKIGTKYEGKANDSDWDWDDDDDFEKCLEQIEGIIQGAINAVNTENLKVILAKFGEFKEEDHEDALWALLIELDLATPVASVEYPTEALDLDLEDPETGFDPDKLPFYKDALLGLGNLPDKAEDINDVDASFKQIVGIIAAGNSEYDGLFDRWTVEVQSAYLNEIVFVIKALNKAGEAYDGWNEDSAIKVNVEVDAEIEKDSDNITVVPLEDDKGSWIQGVWKVTWAPIEFDEITEGVVATLTITGPGEEGEDIEYVAVTEPFLVDARPTRIKVEADGETYKSGETISLTLTLQYGDEDEPQTVYTYEGSHVVMINWGGDSGLQVYNRKATFANGVADGIEFEAWEKGEEVTLAVTIDSDEWEPPVTGNLVISVEAGDPETLDAEVKDDGNILITVKDKLGQVVDWFEPEQAEVQLRVKPEVDEGSALAQSEDPSSAKPGVDGVAYVRFVEGSATIEMVGSAFAEKLASEYQGEEDKVVTLIVELVDYDLKTEIEWTITTGEPGV